MTDRKAQILDIARRDGRVAVDALAISLGVSAHTIRRDINGLCSDSLLRRLPERLVDGDGPHMGRWLIAAT